MSDHDAIISKIVRGSVFIKKGSEDYCVDGELLTDGEILLAPKSVWQIVHNESKLVKDPARLKEMVQLTSQLLAKRGIKSSVMPEA